MIIIITTMNMITTTIITITTITITHVIKHVMSEKTEAE